MKYKLLLRAYRLIVLDFSSKTADSSIASNCVFRSNVNFVCIESAFNSKFFLSEGDRFLPVPPLHTIKHPHLRLVNDSPVLINNFFFARPWFFFRRDFFCAHYVYYVSIGLCFFHLRTSYLVFVDSAKSSAKKAKAQPKNRLPNSISYRRSCSHFNYYLIPGDEHVASFAVFLPLVG